MTPLARIRYGARDFWLMRAIGVESSGFVIYQVTDRGVTKLVDAGNGGC